MLIDVWFLDMVLDVGWDGMVVSTGWLGWLVVLASAMLLGYVVSLVLAIGIRRNMPAAALTKGHYQCCKCTGIYHANSVAISDGLAYCINCF